MKKIIFIFSLISATVLQAQELNFFNCTNGKNADYFKLKNAKNEIVILPFIEISHVKCTLGEFCVFSYSKSNSIAWLDSIKTEKCTYDSNNKLKNINCLLNLIFLQENEDFKKHLNFICFFIDKSYLKGPFYETSEYGDGKYFKASNNAVINIYILENDRWIKIDEQPLNKEIPRTYGETYMLEKLKLSF